MNALFAAYGLKDGPRRSWVSLLAGSLVWGIACKKNGGGDAFVSRWSRLDRSSYRLRGLERERASAAILLAGFASSQTRLRRQDTRARYPKQASLLAG